MESILSAIWNQQTTSAKMFRKMPEVLPIQNHIHLITSSMVHLVHQMQYYFLFEVIEQLLRIKFIINLTFLNLTFLKFATSISTKRNILIKIKGNRVFLGYICEAAPPGNISR